MGVVILARVAWGYLVGLPGVTPLEHTRGFTVCEAGKAWHVSILIEYLGRALEVPTGELTMCQSLNLTFALGPFLTTWHPIGKIFE